MILLPFLLLALLRSYRTHKLADIVVFAMLLVLLAATHRLVILVFIIIFALLCAAIVSVAINVVRKQFPQVFLRNSFRRTTPYMILGSIAGLTVLTLLATNVLAEYSQGALISGPVWYVQLINLTANVVRSGGSALGLGLVGLVVAARQRNKATRETFLAVALIALVPTLLLRQYTGFYILPFLVLYGGLGFVGILSALRSRPRLHAIACIGLTAAVLGTSMIILDFETDLLSPLPVSTYNTALYLRYLNLEGSVVSNDGLMGIRVGSISGVRLLPVGGAGTSFQSPELLIYGFYSGKEIDHQVMRIPLQDLTFESDSLWIAGDIQAEADWVSILQSQVGQAPASLQLRYQPSGYLESNALSGAFFAYNNVYPSALAQSVHAQRYCLFDNGEASFWWLDG
jgi:hypothetical protein